MLDMVRRNADEVVLTRVTACQNFRRGMARATYVTCTTMLAPASLDFVDSQPVPATKL